MIHLILLSGGSGMRLWPLSNNARSKQFLKVLRDKEDNHISMVQRVFAQIDKIPAELDITVATAASQQFSIESQLPRGGYELVLEPERRDTAPAIMLACMHLWDVQDAAPEDTVVVMPIDTFADQDYYNKVVNLRDAVQDGVGDLVLMGVQPTYASSKYGYIIPQFESECTSAQDGCIDTKSALAGDATDTSVHTLSNALPVSRFVEKPDEGNAALLIENGGLWNCGVFAFKLEYLLGVTGRITDATSFEELCERYAGLPKKSFDYEVVEVAEHVAVVPYSGTWKDLGTWNTLSEEMNDAASGRVIGVRSTCENTHVINELGIPMVVSGLKDAVVVATHDGILVSDKDASSRMKPLVERVAEDRPMYEQRRWGEYRVIDSGVYPGGKRSLTKELVVNAGKQLSYQRHAYRAEVWTVASGNGEVVLDGEVRQVSSGDVVDIRPMQVHAVRAFERMHIIEVQLGDLLEEQDIERLGDFWAQPEEGEANE